MRSHRDIIDLWPKPSIRTFADDLGLKYSTAQLMRYRNSISSDHWCGVVEAARRRGFNAITMELLAELKGEGGKPRPKHPRASQVAA
jgi:hypothetical protein